MPLTAGQEVGRYRIIRELGDQGAMSTVYLAEDIFIGGRDVLKELYLSGIQYPADRRESINSFTTEARTLHRLESNPHIVSIRGFFPVNRTGLMLGDLYDPTASSLILVTEYIEGQNLEKYVLNPRGFQYPPGTVLTPEKLPEPEVVSYGFQIADGLKIIHSQKDENGDPSPVIHRDMKPANCMRKKDGTVVVVDFGAAVQRAIRSGGTVAIGTDGYSPIEQYPDVNGRSNVVPRSDVYAAIATLYSLLSGREPRHNAANPYQNADWLKEDIEYLYNQRTVSGDMKDFLLAGSIRNLDSARGRVRIDSQEMYDYLRAMQTAVPLIDLNNSPFWRLDADKWSYSDAREAARVYCDLREGRVRAIPGASDAVSRKLEDHMVYVITKGTEQFRITTKDRLLLWDGQRKKESLKALMASYEPTILDPRLPRFL